MSEALITRRGGGGGDLVAYDVAEVSAQSAYKIRVLVDTNGWEPGMYRGLIALSRADSYRSSFSPWIIVRNDGTRITSDSGSVGCDAVNLNGTTTTSVFEFSSVSKYEPSTNVLRLDYTFASPISDTSCTIEEIFMAKFFKVADNYEEGL